MKEFATLITKLGTSTKTNEKLEALSHYFATADDADKGSIRPNFTMLVYPAYLAQKDKGGEPYPEVAVTTNTPPTFIAMSQDDPIGVENALYYSLALNKVKVPFEVHVYPKGGHGYGLRRTENPLTAWNDRAAEWMKAQGFLNR